VSVIGTVVGMPCNAMWALFGVSIRSVLKAPRNQRIFNLAMGAILLVLAVMFLR
jgi:threonine/homoserine/homoserine lactone efflux protein